MLVLTYRRVHSPRIWQPHGRLRLARSVVDWDGILD
jgi:hypothetical protein